MEENTTQTTTELQGAFDAPWWRQAVVYQIYPRSFADANGDGLGDIRGITSKADYLEDLGVDAVWLSPFYPSALADGGYDVADYRDVDPRLGTLQDFDAMVEALHDRGIKVVVDIVPNHTSNLHVWFQEALAAGRGSKERERYIFREGKGPDGSEPPSDWVSAFGEPAWTQVDDGQWYLHLFASEQPDLNWDNREVHDEFLKTLRFWSDRGVDGFRVDVANSLTKDLSEPLPSWEELNALPTGDGKHPIFDRDEVQDIYAEWREVFNSYDPPRTAVAEAWVDSDRVPRYANPNSLGQAFNFDLLKADFDADQFKKIVTHNVDLAKKSGSSSTWVLSNHDVVRHPTRYGLPVPTRNKDGVEPDQKHGNEWLLAGGKDAEVDRSAGSDRGLAATLFILGLPGSTYIYQGEELGLHEVGDIPAEDRQDPTFFRSAGTEVGRDGCRVPLPWSPKGPSFGFGNAAPHMPQPDWFADHAVDAQGEGSVLHTYQDALALRRQLQTDEDMVWVDTGRSDVLAFERPGGWTVVTNFGDEPFDLTAITGPADQADEPDQAAQVLVSSKPLEGDLLPAATTAWLQTQLRS